MGGQTNPTGWTRRLRQLIVISLPALPGPALAIEVDQPYVVGASGWTLERFGSDVAILQATIGESGKAASGSLVLSCEARVGRLSLILPKTARTVDDRLSQAGSLLVRPLGVSVGKPPPVLVARTVGNRPGALIISETAATADRPVRAIAHILASRPSELDFLLHIGDGYVTIGGLTPLRLTISSRAVDEIAFRDFAMSCE